jgi:hypothetical protein
MTESVARIDFGVREQGHSQMTSGKNEEGLDAIVFICLWLVPPQF